MCGIIGITRSYDDGPIGRMIYDALTRLEYRGYDSVGIAVLDDNNFAIKKDKGPIREVGTQLNFSSMNGSAAIGHSRWATHGPPSQLNAHPHQSSNGDVVVVHNGIIENFTEIKKELQADGVKFLSQTDTEIIPHFISRELRSGKSMVDGITSLLQTIEGTFAIVLMNQAEPDKIYAIKKDNPMVLGIADGVTYCASDIPAFLPWTKKIVTLRDNELAVLSPSSYEILQMPDQKSIVRNPKEVNWSTESAQKGGFPHHMLKEIHEQSRIISTQLRTQQEEIQTVAKQILEKEKIILVGAGTAFYSGLSAFYTIPKFGGPLVLPVIAAEWSTIDPVVDANTIVLACSQSGETLDTLKAIKQAKEKGAVVASIVNVTGSSLTNISDHVIYIHAGPEIGVAASKTYVGLCLAIWRISFEIASLTGGLNNDELKEFDSAISNLPQTVEDLVRKHEAKARDLSKWFSKKRSAFYLGRSTGFVVALEGALKMKEISYIHAEAYPAGESKHGPIALVEDDFPVVFPIPRDETRSKMMGSVQEMLARGATTIGVIEEGDDEIREFLDHYFEIPLGYSRFLSTIVYLIPLQLLAYYTATDLGYSPDMPRNLAKSVTVE